MTILEEFRNNDFGRISKYFIKQNAFLTHPRHIVQCWYLVILRNPQFLDQDILISK